MVGQQQRHLNNISREQFLEWNWVHLEWNWIHLEWNWIHLEWNWTILEQIQNVLWALDTVTAYYTKGYYESDLTPVVPGLMTPQHCPGSPKRHSDLPAPGRLPMQGR